MSNLYKTKEERVLSDCAAIEYRRQMRELQWASVPVQLRPPPACGHS